MASHAFINHWDEAIEYLRERFKIQHNTPMVVAWDPGRASRDTVVGTGGNWPGGGAGSGSGDGGMGWGRRVTKGSKRGLTGQSKSMSTT